MEWRIYSILMGVIEAFIYFWFFTRIAKRKYGRWSIVLAAVMFLLVLYICEFLGAADIVKLVVALVSGGTLVFILYEIPLGKLIIASFFYKMGVILSETFAMGIIMGRYGFHSFHIFLSDHNFAMQAFFIAKVFDLVILRLFLRFFNPGIRKYEKKDVLLLAIQTFGYVIVLLMIVEVSVKTKLTYSTSPYLFSVMALISTLTYFITFQVNEWYVTIQQEKREALQMDAYRKRKIQYYRIKREAQDDVRRIYHDLQNHLKILSRMKEKNLDGLEEYIDQIKSRVEPYAKYHNSGNDVIDMIILEKKEEAEKRDVKIEVQIEEGCLPLKDTFLLSTLFINAIDNAVEGAAECKRLEKAVQIRVCKTPMGLSMLFQNSVEEIPVIDCKNRITKKKDKVLHGLGVGNMERAVKAMGGRITMERVGNKFQVFVLLETI